MCMSMSPHTLSQFTFYYCVYLFIYTECRSNGTLSKRGRGFSEAGYFRVGPVSEAKPTGVNHPSFSLLGNRVRCIELSELRNVTA